MTGSHEVRGSIPRSSTSDSGWLRDGGRGSEGAGSPQGSPGSGRGPPSGTPKPPARARASGRLRGAPSYTRSPPARARASGRSLPARVRATVPHWSPGITREKRPFPGGHPLRNGWRGALAVPSRQTSRRRRIGHGPIRLRERAGQGSPRRAREHDAGCVTSDGVCPCACATRPEFASAPVYRPATSLRLSRLPGPAQPPGPRRLLPGPARAIALGAPPVQPFRGRRAWRETHAAQRCPLVGRRRRQSRPDHARFPRSATPSRQWLRVAP